MKKSFNQFYNKYNSCINKHNISFSSHIKESIFNSTIFMKWYQSSTLKAIVVPYVVVARSIGQFQSISQTCIATSDYITPQTTSQEVNWSMLITVIVNAHVQNSGSIWMAKVHYGNTFLRNKCIKNTTRMLILWFHVNLFI